MFPPTDSNAMKPVLLALAFSAGPSPKKRNATVVQSSTKQDCVKNHLVGGFTHLEKYESQ